MGAAALPPPTSFIHSPHGELRRAGAIPSALRIGTRASLLSPDHRAAINRHHVASFYDKVRGKRVRGERPAGEWQLQVTRIKPAQHCSSCLGRDQKPEPSGSRWAPQALPLVVP